MNRRTLLITVAALVVVAGCAKKAKEEAPEPVPVTVAKVEQKNVPLEIQAIGNVTPVSTVQVRALVSGQLVKVWFHEGDDVKEGQKLFSIDPRPYQAALEQARANLARDQANLKNADAQAARYAELVKKDFVTREDYDRMTSDAEAARAVVAADRAAIDTAKLQLSYCEIRSPITGRTGMLVVHEGNLVKANDTTPLVVINQIEPIQVQFSVPEDDLGQIRARNGAPLEVEVSPQNDGATIAKGTLTFIDNNVDARTGTIALKATFANHDRALWPGQFVTVALTVATKDNAVVVPARAVQAGQKGQFVYVVNSDMSVALRNVSIDRTIGEETIIARGVKPGETVVTDGQIRLNPGSKVEIRKS